MDRTLTLKGNEVALLWNALSTAKLEYERLADLPGVPRPVADEMRRYARGCASIRDKVEEVL